MAYSTPSPTPVTGNPIPTGWGDAVTTDLALLGEFISIYAGGTPLVGSAPASGSATYLVQSASPAVTFSAGLGGLTFGAPFPNGLQSFTFSVLSGTGGAAFSFSGPTTSAVAIVLSFSGTAFTGTATVSYTAVGF